MMSKCQSSVDSGRPTPRSTKCEFCLSLVSDTHAGILLFGESSQQVVFRQSVCVYVKVLQLKSDHV